MATKSQSIYLSADHVQYLYAPGIRDPRTQGKEEPDHAQWPDIKRTRRFLSGNYMNVTIQVVEQWMVE